MNWRLIYQIPFALIILALFLLIGIWEYFDKYILRTEYEDRNKHYRSYP